MSFVQKKNIEILKKKNLLLRVVPHRINTLERLHDILLQGHVSFEIDVTFNSKTTYFCVGHDEGSMSGITLDEYFDQIDVNALHKIWLDVKNLNETNEKDILTRLECFEKKYAIKNKLLVETSAEKVLCSHLVEGGFHVTYGLHTDEILLLAEKEDTKESISLSKKILEKSRSKYVSALSFNIRLYPFVMTYLDPYIEDDVYYHVWDTSLSFKQTNFIDTIESKDYFKNSRVKTILVNYDLLK